MGAYELMKQLNALRSRIIFQEYFPLIAYGIAFLLTILGVQKDVKTGISMTFFFFVIATVAVAVICSGRNKLKRRFVELYKESFVTTVVSSFLEGTTYRDYRGFSQMDVATFGLVKVGNVFNSEDLICGSYKGVDFRQADATILNVTEVDGEKHIEQYFSGRLFEFTYPGKYVQNVKVFSHNFKISLNLDAPIIDLESVDFNNAFDVYTIEPVDAFYILTPQVMERLVKLQRRYNNIGFRFGDKRVCVAIDGINSFEPDYRKKISYLEEKERLKGEFNVITEMIELLGLIPEDDKE
ncbi:MAG: DUF3137 domain-containing protein [Lachnospiraceae bacterium]|nr:DUF3137 domain-containing protein [Lachnospiraceae bacterium]